MVTVDAIRTLGANVQVVYCDLSDLDSVKELFPKALELMGGNIHILVNCAGIQRRSPSLDFPERDWDDVSSSRVKFSIYTVSHVPLLFLGSRCKPQICVAAIASGGPAYGATEEGKDH